MCEKNILIIDENQKSLHQIGILLTGKGFKLATADNITDALLMFQLRDLPDCIFLSETIDDRDKFIKYLLKNKRNDFKLFPIRNSNSKTIRPDQKIIYRPLDFKDFLLCLK